MSGFAEKTICAPATAPGEGGIAIVRLSGGDALRIARQVFSCQEELVPRRMTLVGLVGEDGGLIDRALFVYFKAPASFTGEDVCEFHCHGGAMVSAMVIDRLIRCGAVMAQPGEFSKRAFLNGKMDISAAEATAELIGSLSRAGAKISARRMNGALGRRMDLFQQRLIDIIAAFEAGIEYPEEDIEAAIVAARLPEIEALAGDIASLIGTYEAGRAVRDGVKIAIAGRPNVGKSSLLNAIFGEERAIVTGVAGTTRDVIREYRTVRSLPVMFLDTAGVRETSDEVERIGVSRSREAISEAAAVLLLIDGAAGLTAEDESLCREIEESGAELIVVINKTDLPPAVSADEIEARLGRAPCEISAATGAGIEALLDRIYEAAVGSAQLDEGIVITEARQFSALCRAKDALESAAQAMRDGIELDCAAIDLREAWSALGEITGKTLDEDIIDRIFSKFCLGK